MLRGFIEPVALHPVEGGLEIEQIGATAAMIDDRTWCAKQKAALGAAVLGA